MHPFVSCSSFMYFINITQSRHTRSTMQHNTKSRTVVRLSDTRANHVGSTDTSWQENDVKKRCVKAIRNTILTVHAMQATIDLCFCDCGCLSLQNHIYYINNYIHIDYIECTVCIHKATGTLLQFQLTACTQIYGGGTGKVSIWKRVRDKCWLRSPCWFPSHALGSWHSKHCSLIWHFMHYGFWEYPTPPARTHSKRAKVIWVPVRRN